MKEQNEKQAIEEMAKVITKTKNDVNVWERQKNDEDIAEALYNAGYRKQINAVWVARICEFSDSTKMVEEYYCSHCFHKEGDNDKHFCPSCGARMKGGAE